MMVAEERDVKFSAILAGLLSAPEQAVSRKKLAGHLGVNEATVSHYVHGRSNPSFEALVGIAGFFNVSLDFLVFGERPPTAVVDDPAGVRAEIRRAVLDSADVAGKHLDLVTRISRRLQAGIEQAAKELLEDPANLGPVGFITDAEAMVMESCALRLRAITRMFQHDVKDGERGVFFDVVAGNLRAGVQHEYLLCGDARYWQPQVAVYRELLTAAGLPFEVTHHWLHFRVIDYELPAAVCILDLDIPRLQRMEPILWERQRHAISEDGRWSYISVERHDAQGGVVLEPGYRESAFRLFDRGWRNAVGI
jgi:transcriptional regulator with XRE-family HTH domain